MVSVLGITITSRRLQPAALIAALALLTGLAHAQGVATPAAKPAYLNPSLPAEVRAADLVHRMTLQEKASQLVNGAPAIPRLGVPAYYAAFSASTSHQGQARPSGSI